MANNLLLTAAAFDTSAPKFGGAALNGGYGTAPVGVIAARPFAISAWFKTSTTPSSTQVIVGQNQLFWIGYNPNGTLHFEFGGYNSTAAVAVNSTAAPSNASWHLATISLSSGGTVTATLDGAVVGTANGSSSQAAFASGNDGAGHATGYLAVRTHGGYETTYPFSGEVDEVAVWQTDQFNAGFAVPTTSYIGTETNLISLWHLDGNGNDAASSVTTSYGLTGPASGPIGSPSSNFTVAAQGTLSAAVTISPSDGGGGGTFSPPTVTLSAGTSTSNSFTYTASTSGSKTITVTNSGGMTNPAPFTYTATSAVMIAPSNSAIAYSPANWLVGSASAKTINAGAYFRMIFTGGSCSLSFDISANGTPLPELYYRIDGVSWVQVTLAASLSLTMPVSTTAWPHHHLEVVVKSTSEFLNYGLVQGGSRWSPQNTAVVFTGLTLAAGQSISAPLTLSQVVWFYGDSITEGYHAVTNAASGSQDTDGSDAMISWAFLQRQMLGAEVGIMGFGGAAVNSGGQLGVPSLPNSYNLMWAGQARSFTPAPDLIVINYGENDGSSVGDATFISNYAAVLTGLLAATPTTTKIACMVPFSQKKAADVATAIGQVGSSRVTKVDTTGMFVTADSVDGQHPLGVASLGAIAPAVGNKLRTLLQGIRNRWVRL